MDFYNQERMKLLNRIIHIKITSGMFLIELSTTQHAIITICQRFDLLKGHIRFSIQEIVQSAHKTDALKPMKKNRKVEIQE